MKAKFKGVPGEQLQEITQYGLTFPLGKAVDISSLTAQQKRKLSNHGHFNVTGNDVEDVPFSEAHDYQRDGAAQLADKTGDYEIATAELQGKAPAPNAKEGLVPDMGTVLQPVQTPVAAEAEQDANAISTKPEKLEKLDRPTLQKRAESLGVKLDGRMSKAKQEAVVIAAEAKQAREPKTTEEVSAERKKK